MPAAYLPWRVKCGLQVSKPSPIGSSVGENPRVGALAWPLRREMVRAESGNPLRQVSDVPALSIAIRVEEVPGHRHWQTWRQTNAREISTDTWASASEPGRPARSSHHHNTAISQCASSEEDRGGQSEGPRETRGWERRASDRRSN